MAPYNIQQIFFQESDESHAALEVSSKFCREGRHGDQTINTSVRAARSIRGGAGAFGKEALHSFALHDVNVLDRVRAKDLEPTADLLRTQVFACDQMSDHEVPAQAVGEAPDDRNCPNMLARVGSSDAASDQGHKSRLPEPVSVGVAGATILGDGKVALILDVDAHVAMRRQRGSSPFQMKVAA